MRRFALAVTIVFLASLLIAPTNAAVKAGSLCPKLGATFLQNGKKFTCIKSGKKIVWNKGTSIPKPTPTPSPATLNNAEAPIIKPGEQCTSADLGIIKNIASGNFVCKHDGIGAYRWFTHDSSSSSSTTSPTPAIEYTTLTYPWKTLCDKDPWVPAQWKDYENFAIKYFGCSRPYRFVDVALPSIKPKIALTNQSELNPISTCKIPEKFVKNVAGYTHNVGHRNSWKFSGDLVVQVVPVEFTDFSSKKTPLEEYGKYFEYIKDMFYKTSDGNTRLDIRIPNNYIKINAPLSSFDTGQTWQKNNKFSWKKLEMPRYQNAIFSEADKTIDFSGIKLTIQIVPLSVPDNYIGHGGGFRMDNVQTNEGVVPSTYIMPPANENSDNDWYGVEPFLHLHEIFHATGMLSDHLGNWEQGGDFYGTGNWGHMSGMLTDHLTWDKWLTGMLADSQVICAKKSGEGIYWIKPATYFGKYEKLLVIPISDTRVIAIESQRAAGMNFKLTADSQGALVYTIDVMDTRYDGGFEVIRPSSRTTTARSGPFIYFDAPLKLNESISVWGFKITVVEAGDFGDVVKVEKL